MESLIDQFHFLRPAWLLALIPLAMLWFAARKLASKQSGWQSVLASHLYQHLVTGSAKGNPTSPFWLVAIAWFIGTVAMAGPSWEKLPQPVYQLHVGKVVLIDMSLSMRATDISPDRLTRAKYKAIDLIKAASEGEMGLVAYAGDAFTISPLSSDGQNLTTLLPSLSPEIMPVAGSDPFSGLKMSAQLLENAGFVEGEIFWITDGIEMSQVAEVRNLLSELPYRVSVLGVGTAQGAPIQLLDGDFLKDGSGAIVLPKLDGSQLSALASSTGGVYTELSTDDRDIERLLNQRVQRNLGEQSQPSEDKFGDEWKEVGPYLVLLLLPIAAYAFRRGLLFALPLLMVSLLWVPRPAMALDWQDLWKTADQQAAEKFSQGDTQSAAQQFDDPLWKGVAHYKSGDYESALQAFSAVDSPEANYNRGNALAQLGQLDEAIAAYERVLEQQPDNGDAAANKALVEQLKKQQEQQDQQNQGDQGQDQQQDSQDSQQQESDSASDSSQQQNDQQQQSSQDQQSDPSKESQQQNQEQNQQQSEEQQSDQDSQERNEEETESENEQQSSAQQQAASAQQQEAMTDEEKEQMQRMQNLLNKVPDDPAFLLKRKMMLENQLRKRQRMPTKNARNW